MYYADRLMELPSGVLGMALGTILLPTGQNLRQQDRHEYSRILDWGPAPVLCAGAAVLVGAGDLAEPLTVSLFQYGQFTGFVPK